jgi:arylsulfatase A-like enzyme
MSSHEPFIFVDNYFSTSRFAGVRDERTRHYFTSLAYVDSVVCGYVEQLLRLRPDTYVFIFGDHAPRVASRDFRQASLRHEGVTMEFVPVCVITPDRRVRVERSRAASLLDIAPTLLASAGVSYAITTWGQNLLGDSLTAQVPFRDRTYDRRALFRLVDTYLK